MALRGEERGESYCSCPDFRTNRLGTCKHILHVLGRVERRFPASVRKKPYANREAFVHVLYGEDLTLQLGLPKSLDPELVKAVGTLADGPIDDVRRLVDCLARLQRMGRGVTVYPDAEELIQRRLFERHMSERMAEIRKDPARHPLRKELLKVELLPYQLEGIAFAAGVGRAILADDMGLGKTIQGVGVAEILAREAQISRVLVVCPASLKSQWRNEIHRFSDRTVQLVVGGAAERAQQYDNDSFFTVCNYEQVLRDILAIERARWDLIILDEGQRIKNWESKTARVVKGLRSPFALVLSGTPLENRLDELYSVVQFVDDRRLPPAFRFFHRHRVVDEKGKVLGYKNLDQLRENLRPVLLRRTRESVLQQLPPRTSEIVRIPPTAEQSDLHDAHMRTATMIANKAYISEMDLLRLQKALLMCRMSADSTFLVEKKAPGYSTKLEYLAELFDGLFTEPDRKALLFSEWTTMLDLIAPMLAEAQAGLRSAGRFGATEETSAVGASLSKRPELPPVRHHERRLDRPESPGGQHGHQRRSALEPGGAGAADRPGAPHGPAAAGPRLRAGHRGHDRGESAGDAFRQARSGAGRLGPRLRGDPSGFHERCRGAQAAPGSAPRGAARSACRHDEARRSGRPAGSAGRASRPRGRRWRRDVGAVFNFLGELVLQDPAQAPAEPLVAEVRSRLAECVEEGPAGSQRLIVTLPDRPRWMHWPRPWHA